MNFVLYKAQLKFSTLLTLLYYKTLSPSFLTNYVGHFFHRNIFIYDNELDILKLYHELCFGSPHRGMYSN